MRKFASFYKMSELYHYIVFYDMIRINHYFTVEWSVTNDRN